MEEYIKKLALSYGFSACGFANISDTALPAQKFSSWLNAGFDADMHYMRENTDKRMNPSLLLDGANTAIVVLLNYFSNHYQPNEKYKIASYAYGADYHYVVRNKLRLMADEISLKYHLPDGCFAQFCDSAPVFDRFWAWKAGLGWIGKNSMLINPKVGSFTFIGVMFTTLSLVSDTPISERCGRCTACLDACPTGAISRQNSKLLDANKCLSYFTIESKDGIPDELLSKSKNILFGCEYCLTACPWNRFAKPHNIPELMPIDGIFDVDWSAINNSIFRKQLKFSPLKRAGAGKLRNRAAQINSFFSISNNNQMKTRQDDCYINGNDDVL